MKAFNAVDRKNSFLFFILFYVLTTAVIVVACFFGMSNSGKENEKLSAQVTQMQKDNDFSKDFATKISTIKGKLDTLKQQTNSNDAILKGSIDKLIADLSGDITGANISNKEYYSNVMDMCQKLEEAAIQVKSIGNSGETLSKLQNELRQKDQDLQTAKATIEMLKAAQQR